MPVTTTRKLPAFSIEKTTARGPAPADGLGVEYSVRLAPCNIARIKLERLSATRAFIHWVFVPPAYRGTGLGGQLLGKVLRDADRAGVTITLVARACGTMAQEPLERWYRAHGFRPRGPAAEGGTTMVRGAAARASSRRLRVVA